MLKSGVLGSFRLAVVLTLLASVCGLAAGQRASAQSAEAVIAERDGLIAAQEALLNVYRCRFDIDTDVVPGGCRQGVPALPAKGPDTWVRGEAGSAVGEELRKRDGLIAAQEALLNVYRCRFGIDTHVVEGGCRDTTDMLSATSPGWYPDPTCRHYYRFWRGGNDQGGWSPLVRQQDGEQLVDDFIYAIQDSVSLPGNDPDCIQAGAAEYLPPGERLSSLSIGNFQMCLLRVDGVLTCKGHASRFYAIEFFGEFSDGRRARLSDRFLAVSVGHAHSCAVRVDQTVLCWRIIGSALGRYTDANVQLDAPPGRYTAVSTGYWFSCGLKVDQTIVCWGRNDKGQTAAPQGRFTAVSSGHEHSCGVRDDQAIVCWGDNEHGELKTPAGQFTMVSAGFGFSCGLKTDQTITCWGSEAVLQQDNGDSPLSGLRDFHLPNAYGELDAPSGSFTAVSASNTYACGLRADSGIECWGNTLAHEYRSTYKTYKFVLSSRHPRQFTAISAGDLSVCGMRADGTAECYWAGYPLLNRFRFPNTNQHDVYVYYCASNNAGYTESGLRNEIEKLTNTVGEFYFRESSGLVSIRFLLGGILTPDLPWGDTEQYSNTINNADVLIHNCSPHEDVGQEYNDPTIDKTFLLLVDAKEFRTSTDDPLQIAIGFATRNHAVVRTAEQNYRDQVDDCNYYLLFDLPDSPCQELTRVKYTSVVIHELGHAIFNFDHPHDCSIMGNSYFYCTNAALLHSSISMDMYLDSQYIGCRDRRMMGWPEDSEQCKEPLRELVERIARFLQIEWD